MATIADLNILLSMNSSGFRKGVTDAIGGLHQLKNHINTIRAATGSSESEVRKAISETARVREATQRREAAQLAQNTKALQQAEKVRAKEATVRAAFRHEMMGRIGSGVRDVGLLPLKLGYQGAAAAARQFRLDLAGAYYHLGPFSMRVGPATAALIGLATGMKSVVVEAVSTAAHFEQMEVAFEVMTGSAERAKAVLADIYQFASVTPFEIKDVTRATQQLTAMGFEAETAFQMVKRLGNIAAAMPEGMSENLERVVRALGQMHAKGKVQAEEMTRQLANAGIPAWEALAHRIGVTVPEAMERARLGMVSARDGIMAILDLATSPRFAMMQARQAQTLIGLWSTLKDNLTLTMRSLGDSIIKGFDLKGATASLTQFLGYLKDRMGDLEPAIMRIGTVFRAAFDVGLVLLKQMVEAFTNWTKTIDTSEGGLKKLRADVIGVMKAIIHAGVDAAQVIGNAFIEVSNTLGGLGGIMRGLEKSFIAVMKGTHLLQPMFRKPGETWEEFGKRREEHWARGRTLQTMWDDVNLRSGAAIKAGEGKRPLLDFSNVLAEVDRRLNAIANSGPDAFHITAKSIIGTGNALAEAAAKSQLVFRMGSRVQELFRAGRDDDAFFVGALTNMVHRLPAGIQQATAGIVGMSSALVNFFTLAAKGAKFELPLKPFELPNTVAAMAKDVRGPFGDLQELAKSTRMAFRDMVPHQEMVEQLRGAGAEMAAVAMGIQKTVNQGNDAILRNMIQKTREIGKKLGLGEHVDVAAMEKGSKEAASVIARAANQSNPNGILAEMLEVQKAAKIVEEQAKQEIKEIHEQLNRVAGAIGGVAGI